MKAPKCQYRLCYLGLILCAVVPVVLFVYWNILMPYSVNNVNHLKQSTASYSRRRSHNLFFNVSVNMPESNRSLKYGFWWLRKKPTVDAVIVDEKTNASVLEHLVFIESKKFEIACPQQVRMGRKEDGGWDVCIAGPYKIIQPCIVYSIGLGKPDHKPNPLLWFFNTGLGGTDGVNSQKWSLKTFPTLLRENNHVNSTIDILKMDIEYSEWDSLETMLANPSCLANVKQLMIEFHTREIEPQKMSSRNELAMYWYILRGVSRLGFKLWNVWDNPTCNFRSRWNPGKSYCGCFNMYFLNIKYLF